MRKLTFVNSRGKEIILGNSAPFLVTKLEGLGAVQVSIQMQKSPYQDGVTYIDNTLEPRQLSIEGAILQRDRELRSRQRAEMLNILNPKLGKGTLTYEYDGGSKQVECIVDGAPIFPDKQLGSYQGFIITLLCPNPYWLDVNTETDEIVTWIGGMTFPLRLPTTFANKGPKRINIINQGDVETPVRIEFKGPATNPRITNQATGEYIQVNRTLLSTDKLIITTDFGAKRVEIEDEAGLKTNAFNWIDLGSSFWSLLVGDNVVEYTSDDLVEPAAVSISYRNRYIGI